MMLIVPVLLKGLNVCILVMSYPMCEFDPLASLLMHIKIWPRSPHCYVVSWKNQCLIRYSFRLKRVSVCGDAQIVNLLWCAFEYMLTPVSKKCLYFVCVCDCSFLVLPLSLVLIFCSRKCWLHFQPLVNSVSTTESLYINFASLFSIGGFVNFAMPLWAKEQGVNCQSPLWTQIAIHLMLLVSPFSVNFRKRKHR